MLRRGKMRLDLALWAMCVLLLAGVGSVLADAPATAPLPEVTSIVMKQEKVDLTTEMVGEIKALREVDLRSRVSGNLIKIDFRPGQQVKKGDLLFEIDPL